MQNSDATITFRELITPIEPETFFDEYRGKKAVHIPGNPEKIEQLFNWSSFNRMINMTTVWNAQTIKMALDGRNLAPDEFCTMGNLREGGRTLVPDWPRIGTLLADGASVVLDLMEMLDPGSAAIASALQMATASRVSCNAYYSRSQRPAFKSHFDTMEVFAIHVEGEKTWHLYEGRFEEPIEADGYRYSSFDEDYHARAKGALTQEVTMTPGDVLYIPRGQYHDALAASDACLHLSFGTTRPTGLDFLRTISQAATHDPLFRQEMPTIDEPDAYRTRIRELSARLGELLDDPTAANELLDEQRRRLFDMIPGFDLPNPDFAGYYRVQGMGVKLARRGTDWQIKTPSTRDAVSAETAELANWVLSRDLTTQADMETALPDLSETDIRNGVSHLRTLGILLRA
ncbi:MAG: cupin domain-containing protein [Rhodospirillales bacterium]